MISKSWRSLVGASVVALGLLGVVGCTADNAQEAAPAVSESAAPAADDATLDCVRDRGWEIVVEEDGWSAPGVTEAQFETYSADVEECSQLHQTVQALEDISPEEWQTGYAETVESAQCLRDEGYDIPETPSFQAWQDSYFADREGSEQWVPWLFVPVDSLSTEEWRELEETCPQVGV